MKKNTQTTAKANAVENNKNTATAKKEKSIKLDSLNFSAISEKLEKVNIVERMKREGQYLYPDTIKDINSKEGKQYRNKLRDRMERICNKIAISAKQLTIAQQSKDKNKIADAIAELKTSIDNFDVFYKENYKVQSYKIDSISTSREDKRKAPIQTALDIINIFKNAK